MGFLHMLWDETLAGPTPDTGLGKLRKYDSFSATRSPSMLSGDVPVTRAITILRTSAGSSSFGRNSFDSSDGSFSVPDSPTTPGTPLTPRTPRADFKRYMKRRSTSEHQPLEPAEPTSPTVYDWLVITALDR